MKKSVLLLLWIVAAVQTAAGQNTVESIRQRYADVKNYISTHKGDNQYDGAEWAEYYRLETRQFLPATGGHKEDTWFYYGSKDGSDKIYEPHYLKFVSTSFNFSAMNYYEEYLYDENGDIAFIYAMDPYASADGETGGKCHEFRLYFNKGKVLKMSVGVRDDESQPFRKVYEGTGMAKQYAGHCKLYIDKSKSLRQLFADIEKVTYNYSE